MSNPIERIDSEIKSAMLARENVKLNTLRMLKSSLKYFMIEKKLETPTEADLITVVQKLIKQRQDSVESFQKAGRKDLLDVEMAEIHILKSYLPQALTPEELEALVKTVIAEVNATTKAQVGLVMKSALAKAAGRADGKSINAVALKLLAN